MSGAVEIAGGPVLGPRGTAKLVRQPGPLTARERERLHRHLAVKLPANAREAGDCRSGILALVVS
jgi:hypothetical protein